MRGWQRLVAALVAALLATPAAAACPTDAKVRTDLVAASAERVLQRRAALLGELAMTVGACVPRTAIMSEAIHAAAISAYDAEDIDLTLAGLDAGNLLLADLDDAAAGGDTVRYAQAGWRFVRRRPRDLRVFAVGNRLEADAAEQEKTGSGGLLELRGRELEGAALLSPTLCLVAATRTLRAADTDGAFESGGVALPCLAKFSRATPLKAVVTGLAQKVSDGPVEIAADRAKLLLAYAALLRDDSIVSRLLDSARNIISRTDARQAASLRLAMVVALIASGGQADVPAILAKCPDDPDVDGDPCDTATDYAAAARGDELGAALLASDLNHRGLDANPVNGFLALAYARASGRDGRREAADSAVDLLAGPKLLRLCQVKKPRHAADHFVDQLVVHGGVVSDQDRLELVACMDGLLTELRQDPLKLMLGAALTPLETLPVERTAAFRLKATRVLLVRSGPYDDANLRSLVHAYLQPLVRPEAAVAADVRRQALLLLARAALDATDLAAVDKWREQLTALGFAVPRTLAVPDPVLLRKPRTIEADQQAFNELSAQANELRTASLRRRWGAANPQALLDRAAVSAQPSLGDALSRIDRLKGATSSLRTSFGDTCYALALDELATAFRPLPRSQNALVDSVVPRANEMHSYLSRKISWPGGRPPPSFTLRRAERTIVSALEDLDMAIVIWGAVDRPSQVMAAYRVRLAVVNAYPKPVPSCGAISSLWYTEPHDDVRDALLVTLSADRRASSSDVFARAVADAMAPRSPPLPFRAVYRTPEERRLRRIEHGAERELDLAVGALDVEAAREALAKRLTASSQSDIRSVFAPQTRPGEAMLAARAELRDGEAILTSVRIAEGAGNEIISVLATRDRVSFASARLPDAAVLSDDLGLSAAALRGGGLEPFNVGTAQALHRLILGDLPLSGIRRLYVATSPIATPLGALVSRAAPASLPVAQRYAQSRYVLDDLEVAYLGPSLLLPARASVAADRPSGGAVVFASPAYGTPEPQRKAATSCGLPAVDDLALELDARGARFDAQRFLGPYASESKLYEADRATLLRNASLLLFYAHGLDVPSSDGKSRVRAIALTPSPECGLRAAAPDAQDGFVQPEEVETLDLGPATWVMLAGCATLKGDGLFQDATLPSAFFTAGARLVIGSVEDVSADSTAIMAARILAADRSSDPISEMTRAMRSIRSEAAAALARDPSDDLLTGRWVHPAFFAPWKVMIR